MSKIVGKLAMSGKEYQVSKEGLTTEQIQKENPQLSADEVVQVYALTREQSSEVPINNFDSEHPTEN